MGYDATRDMKDNCEIFKISFSILLLSLLIVIELQTQMVVSLEFELGFSFFFHVLNGTFYKT